MSTPIRRLVLLLAGLLAVLYVRADAGYRKFGTDAIQVSEYSAAGYVQAGRYSPDSTGVIDSIGAWVSTVSTLQSAQFGLAVYAWKGTTPIDSVQRFSFTGAAARVCYPAVVGATVTGGSNYGIAMMAKVVVGTPNFRYSYPGLSTDSISYFAYTYGAWPTSPSWSATDRESDAYFVVYHTTGGGAAARQSGRRRIIQIGANGTATEEDIGPWVPDTTRKAVAAK